MRSVPANSDYDDRLAAIERAVVALHANMQAMDMHVRLLGSFVASELSVTARHFDEVAELARQIQAAMQSLQPPQKP